MRHASVLIVDDALDFAEWLATRCRSMGLDARVCTDTVRAIDEAARRLPDAVLLDVHMPGGSGLAACEVLTTSSRLGSLAVVMMTGDGDDAVRRRCRALGARYVRKGAHFWDRLRPILVRDLSLEV